MSYASLGVYPLFKRSAADLGGAALRVHMTVTVGTISHIPLSPPSMEEEMQLSSSGEEEDREPLSIQSPTPVSQSRQCFVSNRQQTKSVLSSTVFTNDNTFTATVSVERAMHLSIKGRMFIEIKILHTGGRNMIFLLTVFKY